MQIIDNQANEQNKELPYDGGQKNPTPVRESKQYILFKHWPDAPSGGCAIVGGCLKGSLWHKRCEQNGGCNAYKRNIMPVMKAWTASDGTTSILGRLPCNYIPH